MAPTTRQINAFQRRIFTWWKANRRDLPWRNTRDPYPILVSEIMLQQTQVSRVEPKYREFLAAFPTVRALAAASVSDVLKAWKGMGYNRRALYLKRAAEAVVATYGGTIPNDEASLRSLPGLGAYTVRAVMVFAFESDVAMVDTNIRQIITRFFFDDVPQPERVILDLAERLVPKGNSWAWHQALMDYGALALERKRPTGNPAGKRKIPFRDTDRFFRGRIVDLLREGPHHTSVLRETVSRTYGKNVTYVDRVIEGLVRDGLAVSERGVLRLPD